MSHSLTHARTLSTIDERAVPERLGLEELCGPPRFADGAGGALPKFAPSDRRNRNTAYWLHWRVLGKVEQDLFLLFAVSVVLFSLMACLCRLASPGI